MTCEHKSKGNVGLFVGFLYFIGLFVVLPCSAVVGFTKIYKNYKHHQCMEKKIDKTYQYRSVTMAPKEFYYHKGVKHTKVQEFYCDSGGCYWKDGLVFHQSCEKKNIECREFDGTSGYVCEYREYQSDCSLNEFVNCRKINKNKK